MSDPLAPVRRTEQARELFFNQGLAPGAWLAPHIANSWLRSRSAGVLRMEPEPLAAADLRERRAAARLLLESAQPELDALSEHAVRHGCVVVVTDASGLILDEIGSPDFLPKAERVALLPGVDWSEQRCGTNAIGTVLVEREPLAVLGGEHFLAGHGGLGCAAAPIFSGHGSIAGVLDISGDAVRIDSHNLGLVRMASQQIEHRMMLAQPHGELLRFHGNAAMLGSAREALLGVVDERICAANRIALALLGQGWSWLIGRPVAEVLGSDWRLTGADPCALLLPGGRRIVASRQRVATPRARWLSATAESKAADAAKAEAGSTEDVALANAAKVLDAGISVLVTGETGVGKEVFAKRLHAASRRAQGPLVIVNCAALPESLIEAELFGYEAGAFTGARRQGAPGRVREAQGGTLMLDEIGDMPLALQTRLLRVLEDRSVTPLGGGHPVTVDFRLICATHRDLQAMALAGSFRADLMYRINGYPVHLTPLRERADKQALIRQLLHELGGSERGLRLGEQGLARLLAHEWPGNVRELAGVLRTAIALAHAGDTLEFELLAVPPRPAVPAQSVQSMQSVRQIPAGPLSAPAGAAPALADLARLAISEALAQSGGQVALAAERLGVHRSTIYRHLRRRMN